MRRCRMQNRIIINEANPILLKIATWVEQVNYEDGQIYFYAWGKKEDSKPIRCTVAITRLKSMK